MPFSRTATRLVLACTLATLAVTGCKDEEGHVRPWAMVIREGTQVLVHARGGRVDGELTVRAGTESGLLSVRFLDRSGAEVVTRDPYFLQLWAADPRLFEWRTEVVGAFDGRLAGLKPGRTIVLVRWMHGTPGDEHKDRDWPVWLTVLP